MKTSLSLLTGVASLAALLSGATAQTATTDPVGYITVTVRGSSGGNDGFTLIGPTLTEKVDFAGAISAITANSISVSGTPFSVNQFNTGYWVEITSGSGAGSWTNVTSTTTSSVGTADDMDAVANPGDTIKIRKHVTVGSFFGATNAAGLGAGNDISTADEVQFLEGGSIKPVFYSNFAGFEGWKDDLFADASGKVIEPGQGVLVKRKVAGTVNFVQVGHVKTGATKITVDAGFNFIGVPLATGTTLGTSNLFTGSVSTGVDAGNDISGADAVYLLTATGAKPYFYSDFAGFTGWKDDLFGDASGTVIAEGTAVMIERKAPNPAFPWTAPAQVVAP